MAEFLFKFDVCILMQWLVGTAVVAAGILTYHTVMLLLTACLATIDYFFPKTDT